MNYPKILAVLLLINAGGQSYPMDLLLGAHKSCAVDAEAEPFWKASVSLATFGMLVLAVKVSSAIREYATAHYGHYGMQGLRPSMEDATNICFQDGIEAYGLFDGHGGSRVADYAATNLPKTVLNKIKQGQDAASALVDSYVEVDAALEKANIPCRMQGTTAVTALVSKDEIVVANAGDSRAVLCSNGKVKALSEDHKPDREDELARITKLGGQVIHEEGNVPRVQGSLAMSRAIGDHGLSSYGVVPIPDIEIHKRSPKDEFLILACDGVWDVMTNKAAVQFVKEQLDSGASARKAARKLVEQAYRKGSTDNISATVVKLRAKRA